MTFILLSHIKSFENHFEMRKFSAPWVALFGADSKQPSAQLRQCLGRRLDEPLDLGLSVGTSAGTLNEAANSSSLRFWISVVFARHSGE